MNNNKNNEYYHFHRQQVWEEDWEWKGEEEVERIEKMVLLLVLKEQMER